MLTNPYNPYKIFRKKVCNRKSWNQKYFHPSSFENLFSPNPYKFIRQTLFPTFPKLFVTRKSNFPTFFILIVVQVGPGEGKKDQEGGRGVRERQECVRARLPPPPPTLPTIPCARDLCTCTRSGEFRVPMQQKCPCACHVCMDACLPVCQPSRMQQFHAHAIFAHARDPRNSVCPCNKRVHAYVLHGRPCVPGSPACARIRPCPSPARATFPAVHMLRNLPGHLAHATISTDACIPGLLQFSYTRFLGVRDSRIFWNILESHQLYYGKGDRNSPNARVLLRVERSQGHVHGT